MSADGGADIQSLSASRDTVNKADDEAGDTWSKIKVIIKELYIIFL